MDMFVTERVLKEGERGSVTLVRHSVSSNRYILRSFKGSGEICRKLLTVSCPNLPVIYDVKESGGETVVLEEYIPGDNLAELLKVSLLTPNQAKSVVLQTAQALRVLHHLGFVHRDVKPENVILSGDRAVLIDFDASRVVKETAEADTVVLGTTGYAPPEQHGLGQTDLRSDIYALGVMLNILLTGEHPSKKLARGRYGRIVRKCTMMNPDQRYQTAGKLIEDLL